MILLATFLTDQSSTDDFTVALRLVAKPGVRLISGLTNLEREADQLLQEFFQLNREPNLAEMEMLAQACRVPIETVAIWCEYTFDQASTKFKLTRCSCT
jgi:hypothetical protein